MLSRQGHSLRCILDNLGTAGALIAIAITKSCRSGTVKTCVVATVPEIVPAASNPITRMVAIILTGTKAIATIAGPLNLFEFAIDNAVAPIVVATLRPNIQFLIVELSFLLLGESKT